jgi:hypothetical protein
LCGIFIAGAMIVPNLIIGFGVCIVALIWVYTSDYKGDMKFLKGKKK